MTDAKVAEAERRVAEAAKRIESYVRAIVGAALDYKPTGEEVATVRRLSRDLDAAIRAHERAKLVATLRGYMDQGFDTVADMIEEGRLP